MEQHLFLLVGNFDLTACVMWSLGRLHNILCSDQDNRQQTDLLSSEYQTQDLTLYTPSGSFQSLLVTEVAAGYRGKPECETLICISLYQLPTSKMSLISLVTAVSTAPTFNMQYCKSVAAEI